MGDMPVFSTQRLAVRTATSHDIDFYYQLWTSPQGMRFVGFPHGLPITRDEIQELIEKPNDDPPFNSLLVVELIEAGTVIGECKLYRPESPPQMLNCYRPIGVMAMARS